jgi:hypothetical protein
VVVKVVALLATQNKASTSKNGPSKHVLLLHAFTCFYHFYFQICFAPQQRALFEDLNVQKCSAAEVF